MSPLSKSWGSCTPHKHSPCKVLERLKLLQCVTTCLQYALTLVSGQKEYLGLFSAKFCSRLATCSWRPIKRMVTTLFSVQKILAYHIVRGKQTVDSPIFSFQQRRTLAAARTSILRHNAVVVCAFGIATVNRLASAPATCQRHARFLLAFSLVVECVELRNRRSCRNVY